MKTCPKCKEKKSNEEFYKDKRNTNGLSVYCKKCSDLNSKKYHKTDKAKEYNRKYHDTPEWKKYNKEYLKNKRATDPQFRLRSKMSSSIAKRLLEKDNNKWEERVGYSLESLMKHLEKQFEPWMNWDNYGKGKGKWNIEHIRPISSFKFSSSIDSEFKKCWALSNLQPLEAIANIRKGNKY